MDKQALGKVLDEYTEVYEAARSAYSTSRCVARSKYEDARNTAWSEYGADRGITRSKRRASLELARRHYQAAWDDAWSEYQEIRDAAWARIAETTRDPLVTWIVMNCSEFKDEALLVLRALPTSLAEIDRLAKKRMWCDSWQDFRWDALDAGVIAE